MSFHPNDPVLSVISPLKGHYPMTVRTVCVTPGQLLNKGDRIAELLEPSGRWVSLVASEAAGQIKAVRVRVGDHLTAPTEIATLYVPGRSRSDDLPPSGVVSRVTLEALHAEAFADPIAVQRPPLRPITTIGRDGVSDSRPIIHTERLLAQLWHHKLMIAACVAVCILAFGGVFGTGLFTRVTQQPEITMEQLWSEMRAARIAAAEAENAREGEDISTRAADQKRARAAARASGVQSGACAGFFIGMRLPGLHITRGVRHVTYLDTDRGVGAYIWTKSQATNAFSCADERR